MAQVLIGGTAALLICIFLSPKFIDFLRLREFGQHVRDDGPQGHLTKAGTPTMGGVIMFVAIAAPFAILSTWTDWRAIGVFGAAVACALLGFADDYMKIVKRRSLGLRARTSSCCSPRSPSALWLLARKAGLPADLHVSRVRRHCASGRLLSGAHLPRRRRDDERREPDRRARRAGRRLRRDRPDGLRRHHLPSAAATGSPARPQLALLAACLVGACVGFLWFNAFPATIFMGDTGSLGLGGAIAGLAVMTQTEVLLILLGGIFVIEAVSVLIQVVSFQVFRKRVFLMAPIHHHFELKAWSETKIILRFWIITAIGAAIGFTIYAHSIK